MNNCDTCKYRAAKGKAWKCEYICIVGHSRGCEPGDLCIRYEKGDRLLVPFISPVITGHSDENDLNYFLEKFNHYN